MLCSFSAWQIYFSFPLCLARICVILSTLLAPIMLFFFNFPSPAVNSNPYLNFCRGLTFILTLDLQCQDLALPSEMIWLFGHQQMSPGCTLSKETVAALLPKETFTCLQNTPTSTVNSIFQKFPHLLSILKHSQGKSTNQDQMYLLQQCWVGGPAQVLKLPWFLIALQWGSTQECGACWWAPAPSRQEWQCGGSPGNCPRAVAPGGPCFLHLHITFA